mgnify:CR=1
MQFICGYKSKEEITITTFHLPTRGLDLSTNHHIYQYDIIRFVVMGDIILVEDFNAQTKDEQTSMIDTIVAIYGEVMVEEVGLKQQDQDMGEVTKYVKTLSSLGKRTWIFVIYNDLSQWPKSDALTCWNQKGGVSTIGYLMGSPSLIPEITNFTMFGRPIGLAASHAYLCF